MKTFNVISRANFVRVGILGLLLLAGCTKKAERTYEAIPTSVPGQTAATAMHTSSNSSLQQGPVVISLSLVNAKRNRDQPPNGKPGGSAVVTDRSVIYLGTVGKALNLRADVSSSGAASVKFGFDGNPNYRIESIAPYMMGRPKLHGASSWNPSAGDHVVTATAFSGPNATGVSGKTHTIHFSVSNAGAPASRR